MSRHTVLTATLLVTLGSGTGCCFDLLKLHLPDGGLFGLPDAGALAQIEYDAAVQNLGAILSGGSTQFSGLSFVTTLDGGVRTVVLGPGTDPLLTVVYPDSNHVLVTGDLNQDGLTDYEYQGSVSGTTVLGTELTDSNFDGVFDIQDIQSFDTSRGYPLTKTEAHSLLQLPDGGGADAGVWVQAWSYQGPAEAQQGGGGSCDGRAGFPSDTTSLVPVPGTQISIVTSGPGSCSTAAAGVLVIDFESAIRLSGSCYLMVNPKVGTQLAIALATQPMLIGCGNGCTGVDASTDMPGGTFGNWIGTAPQRMNLNAARFTQMSSEADRVEVLIHELLHFAGIDHSPPKDGSPSGHDLVYGCGRYCNKCQSIETNGGISTPQGFSYDCVDCADTAHQLACGSGLALVSNCSPSSCGSQYCKNPGDETCCDVRLENCYPAAGLALADRDKFIELVPTMTPGCINAAPASCRAESGCSASDAVADWAPPVAGTNPSPCRQWPVGWCTGPPTPP